MSKTAILAFVTLLTIALIIFMKESKTDERSMVLKEGSVILAFGDSLTNGFGVRREFSYPSQMKKKTGLKIINAGVDGELSSEGLARLPSYLKDKVDLVILCHGGNDILQKRSAKEIKNNLLAMIKLIKENGSEVLLVGVPDFSIFGLDTHKLYEEVADESDILFEDEILTQIERDPAFKSDYIHPNEKGYEMMADAFIEILNIKSRK